MEAVSEKENVHHRPPSPCTCPVLICYITNHSFTLTNIIGISLSAFPPYTVPYLTLKLLCSSSFLTGIQLCQVKMQEDKKTKVKKGWLAVQVGLADEDGVPQRFIIPISYLRHPLVVGLLDRAHEVYGYHPDGPLRLPCSVDDFLHLRWRIKKESSHTHHHSQLHHPHHHHLPHALSFHSC